MSLPDLSVNGLGEWMDKTNAESRFCKLKRRILHTTFFKCSPHPTLSLQTEVSETIRKCYRSVEQSAEIRYAAITDF